MSQSDANQLAQTAVHLLSNYFQSRDQIAQFRQQMILSFNESELRDLCFDLQINFDSLPGSGTSDKTREIIALCLRQGQAKELFAYCQRARPNAFAQQQFPAQDTVDDESTKAASLHAGLLDNLQADAYAAQTLTRLAEQPASATRQAALASLLTELMSANEELSALIRQSLAETAVGDQINQQVTLSGEARAGDINMIGKVEGNVPDGTFNKEKRKKWWWPR
jgi:hypothetical protein